jgi:radical SAM-linked protein
VPGNGEDTVLAKPMVGSLPTLDAAVAAPSDPAAYREPAKGAAYRQKAMPDLPSATRRLPAQGDRVFRHRITFEKRGDARFLSHRNTMDVLERAIRAAGLPARYSEGFNPHMKLSMGPALALGIESREEVFEAEGTAPFGADAADQINSKLPSGVAVLDVRLLPAGEAPLSRAVKGARYSVRLDDAEQIGRATEAIAGQWRDRVPALQALSLDTDASGARLRFEVNLDASAGETSTPKKVLEKLLAIPPEAQASLSVTREGTLLS